jgi:MFS family permease
MILWGIGGGINASFLPNYLSSVIRLTNTQLGFLFSTIYGLQAILYVIVGYLVSFIGCRRSLLFNVTLMSIFCVLISLKSIFLSYVAVYVMIIATMFGNTALFTYIAKITSNEFYGKAYGYLEAIWFSSSALGVVLGGVLWNFNNEFLFIYILPMIILQTPIIMKLKKS